MPKIDYYQILGIEPHATRAEVRRAFRSLAIRYHPDQNPTDPDAEERFKLITQAYKVLMDPKKRAQYDRTRQAALTQRERQRRENRHEATVGPRAKARPTVRPSDKRAEPVRPRKPKPPPWWQETVRPTPQPPPKEQKSKSKPGPGDDLTVDITITSAMAETGGRQPIVVSYWERCPGCEGSGARPGSVVRPCPECDPDNPSPNCIFCSGRGRLIQSFCPECEGEGRKKASKTVVVTIPAFAKDGQTIRVPGEGMPAPEGGKAGDLVVRLHVKPGAEYEQRGNAVYSEIVVTPAIAALGGAVRVKTIDGWAELVIPPGTRSGTVLRLEGKGPVISGNERGDHFVKVKILSA